jgi:hypothetical protein
MIFIENLPQDSAFKRKHASKTGAEWTLDQHLMAMMVDLLARGNWQRQGKKHAQKPKPIPRPGKRSSVNIVHGNVKGLDPRKVREFLESKRPRREAES